ncbi:ABC transporter permease [Alphaproteobacteria bacterium]|nr:ABC transporter permease [Alphaproteobacteria bacterium]
MSIDLILNGLLQGLVLAIVAYGIMVPFRFLDFADLTTEGSYPLGGAICATCMTMGLHLVPAILLSILCSGIMGICTSIIHLKFRVNTMLAGIILSTMAYSVNLRIMGKPNIALFDCTGLFSQNILINILILCVVLFLLILPLALFLRTDRGLRFRAVGLNPSFAERQGIDIKQNTILGLFLAGGLAGLAGSLMVQIQSYMDVGMGIGIIIHGLAGLMIGEAIVGNHTMNRQLLAPLLGALVYQQIQGIALSFGLAPSDLKFFTGSIVLIVIAIQKGEKYAKI